MQSDPEHPLHWRPVILAFSDEPERRERILRFASWIESGSGFTTAVCLVEGDGLAAARKRNEAEAELATEIAQSGMEAFVLAVASPDAESAVSAILQAHGLGPVRANTMLLNWFDGKLVDGDHPQLRTYSRPLRAAARLGCNVIIFEGTAADMQALEAIPARKRRIDVWYSDDATGRLMLLLSYLMTRAPGWNRSKIRLMLSTPADQDADELRERLKSTLRNVRIEADVVPVESPDGDQVAARSRDAAVVFLPFRLADEVPTCPFAEALDDLLAALPVTALVLAAQDISLDAEPESGRAAQAAQALDALEQARMRVAKLEKEAERLAREAEEARQRLSEAVQANRDPTVVTTLEGDLAVAEKECEDARRRVLKAHAKAEQADREARALKG